MVVEDGEREWLGRMEERGGWGGWREGVVVEDERRGWLGRMEGVGGWRRWMVVGSMRMVGVV